MVYYKCYEDKEDFQQKFVEKSVNNLNNVPKTK